jgi:phospholipase C
MLPHWQRIWRAKCAAGVSATALSALGLAATVQAADPELDAARTATPIKHVIIIVGENRSFDHVFATPSNMSRAIRPRWPTT